MNNWQRMRKARWAKNLNGFDMAAKVGICPTQYYKIEEGKVNPQPATIRKLAVAFGVSAQQILGVEPWE